MSMNDPAALAETLPWCTGPESPTGRRVLDVRPASRTLLSASQDPEAALRVFEVPSVCTGFPEDPVVDVVDWTFSSAELSRIRAGFVPTAMEDKWCIVSEEIDGSLRVRFFRSWSHWLAFVLDFDGARAKRLVYAARGGQLACETVRAIVDGYLLARPCVLRAPSDLGTDKARLMAFAISTAGRRADFVEPRTRRR